MTKCPVCNGVGAIYEGNTRIDECGNCLGGANCPGCDPYKEAGTCIPASYAAEKVFCEDCSMKWVENQGRYWEIPPPTEEEILLALCALAEWADDMEFELELT